MEKTHVLHFGNFAGKPMEVASVYEVRVAIVNCIKSPALDQKEYRLFQK
jgi:hypothetical protein